MFKFVCVLLLAQLDSVLQVASHKFECPWCDVSVAAAHGTWEAMVHKWLQMTPAEKKPRRVGFKGRGEQKKNIFRLF